MTPKSKVNKALPSNTRHRIPDLRPVLGVVRFGITLGILRFLRQRR